MPFVTMYMPYGLNDQAMEKCLREITAAGDAILENTLARMIRVTVFESRPECVYEGGQRVTELKPVVVCKIGPGRSQGAKDAFVDRISEILHQNLGCRKEDVRAFVEDNEEGHHFMLGGKPKDFTVKVK